MGATYRFFGVIICGALMACAGAPTVAEPTKSIHWQSAASGAYLKALKELQDLLATERGNRNALETRARARRAETEARTEDGAGEGEKPRRRGGRSRKR